LKQNCPVGQSLVVPHAPPTTPASGVVFVALHAAIAAADIETEARSAILYIRVIFNPSVLGFHLPEQEYIA
jgi:hypothetical protein